ncbi:MAG: N-acetylmuramoyl-L-alanine amidase family protein [Lawsonibacter sp.]|jgi:N-acetylmuramoyl-L-alanine amidase
MEFHQQLLTENDCYKSGRSIRPQGVMVHSTGANNPRLSRYVAPNDGLLGEPALRHWNQSGTGACTHAFIGKLEKGGVAVYQTLPWTMRGWHAGRGSRGSANDTHISFEICEDDLEDPKYFQAVYRAAVELTAKLCQEFQLDPTQDGVVICHSEGYARGIATNHADVTHWFPKFKKDMDQFRADVVTELEGGEGMTQEQFDRLLEDWLERKASQPSAAWAGPVLKQAIAAGWTDGTRPQAFATRQEVAAMILAAKK